LRSSLPATQRGLARNDSENHSWTIAQVKQREQRESEFKVDSCSGNLKGHSRR
jgi:hypothetical protein